MILSRRNALFSGGAFITLGMMPGCVPILGLFLRGGAVRAFASGARSGGLASAVTLGRGLGIAGRTLSSSRTTVPATRTPVRISTREGRELAQSRHEGSSTLLMQGTRPIFRSNSNSTNPSAVTRQDHIDLNGNYVGRSNYINDVRVEHYGNMGRGNERLIGFDEIIRAARIVRHFDRFGSSVGETEITYTSDRADIISDEPSEDYLSSLLDQSERCPEVEALRLEYTDMRRRCDESGDFSICEQVSTERRIWRDAERACEQL